MKNLIFIILLGVISAMISSLFDFQTIIILLVALTYLFISVINIKTGILLTLFLRSSMDIINFSLHIGGLDVKVTYLLGFWVIFLALVAILKKQVAIKNELIMKSFIVFLVLSLPSSLTMGNFALSMQEWLKFLSLFSMYLLVLDFSIKDALYRSRVINAVIFSSFIPLLFGLYQYFTKTGFVGPEGIMRLNSTFNHPNPFAFYLVIIVFTILIKILDSHQRYKIQYLVVATLATIELVLTFTRGAWLGLAVAGCIVILKTKSKKKYIFIFAMIIVGSMFNGLISERFEGVTSSRMEESSLATRLYIWSSMVSTSLENPILGKGLGTFTYYTNKVLNWPIEAHNEYLRQFLEGGILGLLSYLFLIGSLIRSTVISNGNPIRAIVFALVLSFSLMGFGDNIVNNLVSQWYLWALIGVACSLNPYKVNQKVFSIQSKNVDKAFVRFGGVQS